MTIRKSAETGHMIAQCDQCFDVVDFEDLDGTDKDDWSEAKERVDMDGWKTKRIGHGPDAKWINICCDCVGK